MSLPTIYQQYIHTSRYARYDESIGRRETWHETVRRYFDFMESHLETNFNYNMGSLRQKLEGAVASLQVMPSMRALMTAGVALQRDHTAGYNCSYIPIDDVRNITMVSPMMDLKLTMSWVSYLLNQLRKSE
jgi:ribonucleoside-diphosphate reductase alpha chain